MRLPARRPENRQARCRVRPASRPGAPARHVGESMLAFLQHPHGRPRQELPLGLGETLGGEHHDRNAGQQWIRTQRRQHAESVEHRHHEVEHEHVRRMRPHLDERALTILRLADAHVRLGEKFRGDATRVGIVVHDEHFHRPHRIRSLFARLSRRRRHGARELLGRERLGDE